MTIKVTPNGLIIPEEFLEGIEEFEIRKEDGFLILIPTNEPDPILELGKHPVKTGVSDGSVNHDKYIYGQI
jgi:hypothetical protein